MTAYTPAQEAWLTELETTTLGQAQERLWKEDADGVRSYCCLGLAAKEICPDNADMARTKWECPPSSERSIGVYAPFPVTEALHFHGTQGQVHHAATLKLPKLNHFGYIDIIESLAHTPNNTPLPR